MRMPVAAVKIPSTTTAFALCLLLAGCASQPATTEATAVKAVPPIYPLSAALRGTGGRVTLAFIIDAQGKARYIRVIDSRPAGIFDEYAEAALKQSVFHPRYAAGTPAPSQARFTYLFRVPAASHCVGASSSATGVPLKGPPPSPEPVELAGSSLRIGYVTLAFTIDTTGRPRKITVLDAYPPGQFDQAAREDLSQSHFRPRCINGKVAAAGATYTYTFRIR